MNRSKVKRITRLVLRIILGVLLLLAASGKFTMSEIWIQRFNEWGYPKGFHIVTGILEAAAAILIFIPKYWLKGVYLTLAIMIAAALTHLLNGEADQLLGPGIYMILIGILILLRKD